MNREDENIDKLISKLDPKGVDFAIISGTDSSGRGGKVTKYYSNKSKIKISKTKTIKNLKVIFSSVETDNNEILHNLLNGTR